MRHGGLPEYSTIRSGRYLHVSTHPGPHRPITPVAARIGWACASALGSCVPSFGAMKASSVPRTVTSGVDYLPDLQIVDGSFLAAPHGPGSRHGGLHRVDRCHRRSGRGFDAYVAQDVGDPSPEVERIVDGSASGSSRPHKPEVSR